MVMTPSSFTYENLTNMKFKELQKLSVQFHVNKRWAKKQELVENLLALSKKEKTFECVHDEEKEWRDGSTVFNNLQEKNENDVDRRLTFNVNTKSNLEQNEAHLTFEVPQNGKNLLDGHENSRQTYDIPPRKSDLADAAAIKSRDIFDVPLKNNLTDDVDPRATFDIPQNTKKLLNESEVINKEGNEDLGKIKHDINVKAGEERKKEKRITQVKTLTIPCARVTRRTRKDGEISKTDSTPIKMSKKSINIKKSTRIPVSKNDLIKSPALSSLKNSINKKMIIQSLTKPEEGKIPGKKLPIRLQFNDGKEEKRTNGKENVKQILKKGETKTGDEHFEKNSNLLKVNFKTPPPSVMKTSKTLPLKKTPLRREIDSRHSANGGPTPGNKLIAKPITATKMPDFNKIHKRQFEQMDSLHDYIRKKEERIKKLFGTPQPGQKLQTTLNKSAPVFRFQSKADEKENKGVSILNKMATPLKKKENNSKSVQKETFKSKLPPSKVRTDIKDKNRSHIHGVRTNKRFELQMKFRNM